MKKLIVLALLFTACSGEIKNTATTETRSEATLVDSTTCSAVVNKGLILNDSELVLPKIKLEDPVISAKINKHFSLENLTGYALDEIKQQKEKFKQDSIPQGLTFLGYEITYNKDCLLSITINIETCGAYPSGYSDHYNFDLSTGDSIFILKLLDKTKINDLVKLCDDTIQNRIAAAKRESTCDDFISEQLADKKFTQAELADFFVTETDVVFVFHFGFPHVLQGAEPGNLIKIPRTEFRKYLQQNPYKL
jgi:hypothetical protein